MKQNIKLTIQYDGTVYAGWQIQENATTVQQVLEEAIRRVVGEEVRLIASGRTDAGVHAYGQVANFRTSSEIPGDKFHYHLKGLLPPDIDVICSEAVPWEFHSRYDALRKTYRYLVYNGESLHPTLRHLAAHVSYPLDVDKMQEAACRFLGEHDFRSFMASNSGEEQTIRSIDELEVCRRGNEIGFRIVGRSFLRNMIRILVGTLVEAGRGRIQPEDVTKILAAGNREAAGPTMPACGLYLMSVEYEKTETK